MIQNTNYGASKTYVNTKVDKLTTSGLKAYTHDGATQGEIDVSNTYTPATLALRDANGRLHAADPASGATDKTLTTANWISQTGDSAPNNLAHRFGDETIYGRKDYQFAPYSKRVIRLATAANKWWKLWEFNASGANNLRMWFKITSGVFHFYIYVTVSSNGSNVTVETYGSDTRYPASYVKISRSGTNLILWLRTLYATTRIYGEVMNETNVNYQSYSYWSVSNDSSQYDEPTTQDYDAVITATYNGA